MKNFDCVIGYQREKEELMQICDMLKNKEVYERLGAKLPKGVVLEGRPGIGKTLLATSFLKASGLKSYVVRRTKQSGDFTERLEGIFDDATKNSPSIILLDDMDKFATDDKNKEEYIAVQTCIDNVKDKDVFVIATVNDTRQIPPSLLRPGRFDRRIFMQAPENKDAEKIIAFYMDSKSFIGDINREDIVKMLVGNTCAEVETILNEAAVYAGYERKESIGKEHLIRAYLKQEYDFDTEDESCDQEELEQVAYHEAGHLIVLDIIKEGSVGLASISSEDGGVVKRCTELKRRPYEVLVSLGGKAAVELKFGRVASGAFSDIRKATRLVNDGYADSATGGFSFSQRHMETPESEYRRETVIGARLEEFLFKAKEIIANNMEYLEKVAKELIEKRVLLNSDVKRIRESVVIKKMDIA